MLAYLFVMLAVVVRFIPHPWTFTPVAASLLFLGARGSRRWLWVPFVLLAASDVILTKFVYVMPFSWDHFVTWGYYVAILWLGTRLGKNAKPLSLVAASLASSVSFFLLSNFAVWACWNMYSTNLSGLMTSYVAGWPFFRQAVMGDLLFTAAFFATPVALQALSEVFSKEGDHTAAV